MIFLFLALFLYCLLPIYGSAALVHSAQCIDSSIHVCSFVGGLPRVLRLCLVWTSVQCANINEEDGDEYLLHTPCLVEELQKNSSDS